MIETLEQPLSDRVDRVHETLPLLVGQPLEDIEVALSDMETAYRRISVVDAHIVIEEDTPVLELTLADASPESICKDETQCLPHLVIPLGSRACLDSANTYGLQSLASQEVGLRIGLVKNHDGDYLMEIIDPDSNAGSHIVRSEDEKELIRLMAEKSKEDNEIYPDSNVDYTQYEWLFDPAVERPQPFVNSLRKLGKKSVLFADETPIHPTAQYKKSVPDDTNFLWQVAS